MTEASNESDIGRGNSARLILVSGRDVEDAKRLLRRLAEPVASSPTLEPLADPYADSLSPRPELTETARRMLSNRRLRLKHFNRSMFGEPAWDILLVLYLLEGAKLTIARLSDLADASPSTTLRWVDYLEEQGLLTRSEHPLDRRAVYLQLTDKARTELELYLTDTLVR